MGVLLVWVVFLGAVAYVTHGALLAGRKIWSAVTGRPVQQVLVGISPEARRGFRIAGRIALGVTIVACALLFLLMLALSGAEF
jgi:hypothetical protein